MTRSPEKVVKKATAILSMNKTVDVIFYKVGKNGIKVGKYAHFDNHLSSKVGDMPRKLSILRTAEKATG
jgi:hypothetical protein